MIVVINNQEQYQQYDFEAKIRFEWNSGWWNGAVKWFIMEWEGWKVCNSKNYYFAEEDITAYIHVKSYSEGENWLEYLVEGYVIGKGNIPEYYENGIVSGLRKLISEGIKNILKIIIGLVVIVAIIKFAGEELIEFGKEATTGIALPLAGAIAVIFISMAVYEYSKRRK